VVIPTYNSVRFLKESLDSVISQEYPAHEIIVVDGASNDGTRELCEEYGSRIRFLQQPRNEGVGSALNVGVRTMTGDWFKEHDADDILERNALRVLAAAAISGAEEVIYGDYSDVDSKGRNPRVRRIVTPDETEDFVVASWRMLVVSHVAAMVRRSSFDSVGLYDDTFQSAEDYDWFLRAAMVHGIRFRHLPEIIAKYRRHRGQTTNWRRRGRILQSTRRRSEAKVRLLLASEADPRLVRHYSELTRRFRRAYAPIVYAVAFFSHIPRKETVAYYLAKMFPRTYNRIYWALNPPVT